MYRPLASYCAQKTRTLAPMTGRGRGAIGRNARLGRNMKRSEFRHSRPRTNGKVLKRELRGELTDGGVR